MKLFKRFFVALLLVTTPLAAQKEGYVRGVAQTDQTAVELVSEFASITPGLEFEMALRFEMKPHWHIYWKNPGEAGMPPRVEWQAPDGFEFGEIEFPTPHRIESPPGFISYAYDGEVFLLVKAKAPANLKPGETIEIKVDSNWLICEEMCVPGSAKVVLDLQVVEGQGEASEWSDEIAQARSEVPLLIEGELRYEVLADTIMFEFDWEGFEGVEWDDAYFFVEQESITNSAQPQTASFDGSTLSLSIVKSDYYPDQTPALSGILYNAHGFAVVGGAKSVYFSSNLSTKTEVPVESVSKSDESPEPLSQGTQNERFTLSKALLYAFIGGMLLNLMPCVFPVISIKVMGFVQQAGEDKSKILKHGLVFAVGVLVSFWVLSGLLVGLRSAGEKLGWGFQMQNPYFVGVMLVFMFVFGLSLAGVFEIGASAISLAGKVKNDGFKGSFMSGVLATIVATPCTGPFMSGALGYALTLPAFSAMTVFTFLALGMAMPYVALSANPKLIQKLPRPGPWMETFKQVMSFFMFATCVWLINVMLELLDAEDSVSLLGGLVVIGVGAWVYGKWSTPVRRSTVRWRARIATAVLLVVGMAWLLPSGERLEVLRDMELAEIAQRDKNLTEIPKGNIDKNGVEWVDFSPKLIELLEAREVPYYVDFTASWCLICQANKKRVFTSDEVKRRIDELGVVMVKGDWTRQNPIITEILEFYGRSGVPLNLFHSGEAGSDVVILPELLNPRIVLEILESAKTESAAGIAIR